MADSGTKPSYLVEYELKYIDEDPVREFFIQDITITDAVNTPFCIRATCKIASARNETVYDACASRRLKDVSLLIRRKFPDGFTLDTKVLGMIVAVERSPGAADDDPFTVTIAPALHLLAHMTEGGTWHNRSYADVLRKVLRDALAPYARTIEDRTVRSYPEIDLIVRSPTETLLDFARKLMARTGINFYFHHDGAAETLVLCDDNSGFVDASTRLPPSIPYKPQWMDSSTDAEERILSAVRGVALGTSEIEFVGFDVASTPQEPVKHAAAADGGHKAVVRRHDAFRINERENPEVQTRRRAELHGEVTATQENMVSMQTTLSGALAGRRYRFELAPGDAREYIVMSVMASGRNLAAPQADYINSMTAVPAVGDTGQPVNVRSTDPPADIGMAGVHRAEVVAIENDPIDTDGFLRCRLRFPWDQQSEEVPTTYAAVLQGHAGTHGGTQYIPRAGDRCLVSFIGGDPERPVILGCVYDNQIKPPPMGVPESAKSLPASSSWLGWNFFSVGDKSRQSMFCIDVTAGAEMMFVNAPYDWRKDVGHDSDLEITNDERHTTHGFRTVTVDKDYDQTVVGSRTELVKKDYTLTVEGNHTVSATGGSTSSVTGAVKADFKAGMTTNVEGGNIENVLTGDRVMRSSSGSILMTAGSAINGRAPSINFSQGGGGGSGNAGSGLTIANVSELSGLGGAQVTSGPSRMEADAKGVALRGPSASVHDQAGGTATLTNGAYVVQAPQGITLRCGATELRLTPQGVFVNGQQLSINAARTEIHTGTFNIVRPDGSSSDLPD